MPFYIFAWSASLLQGLGMVSGKFISKYLVKNPWLFIFLWNLVELVITIPLAFYYNVTWPTHWNNLLLASFFYTLASVFYIFSIYKLDVSVFSPLFSFRTAFSVFLGVIFLGEVLSGRQQVLLGLVFLAGLFVSVDEKYSLSSFFKWPVFLGITEMFILSLMSIFINRSAGEVGYWETLLGMAVFAQIIFLFTIPLFVKDIKKVNLGKLLGVGLVATEESGAQLLSAKAFVSNVGISTAIFTLPMGMILAFFLSLFHPGLLEKHSLKVYLIRFSAAAIMFVGAYKLSV